MVSSSLAFLCAILFKSATANAEAFIPASYKRNALRRRLPITSNESDEDLRQRIRIKPFAFELLPITSLSSDEEKKIHFLLEDVATEYIKTEKFPDQLGFKLEAILLTRNTNVFGSRTLAEEEEVSAINFTGGAASFIAPDTSLLPSSDEITDWIEQAVKQDLVPALQQSTLEKTIVSVNFETVSKESEVEEDSIVNAEQETPGVNNNDSSGNGGTVAGTVVSAVAVVGVIAALLVVGYKRRRPAQNDSESVASDQDKSIGGAAEDETLDNTYDNTLEGCNGDSASVDEQSPAVSPIQRRLNLFVDFFQPFFTMIFRSFNFWTSRFSGEERQTKMITR